MIWSHFITSIPRNEIEIVRGDWALSTVKSWKQGLAVHIAKNTNNKYDFNYFNGGKLPGGHLSRKFSHRGHDLDDFEVFIPAGSLK